MSIETKKNTETVKRALLTAPSILILMIVGGTVAISLAFLPGISDAFNAPKFWLLILLGACLIPFLLHDFIATKSHTSGVMKLLIVILLTLLVTSLISALNADVLTISFLGEYRRKNGLLTTTALVLLFLAAARFIRIQSIGKITRWMMACLVLIGSYAALQSAGLDFVNAENQSPFEISNVITTLGNPNFTGALLGILGVTAFAFTFNSNSSKNFRIFALLALMLTAYGIAASRALQGILCLFIGCLVILIVKAYQKKRAIGHIAIFGFFAFLLLVLAGMLQKGPLESLIWKNSLRVRGFYWRAGWEMFLDHPIFGVGIDSFGAYFKEYIDVDYWVRFGSERTSNNAHNVIIQTFATGGLLVGIAYLSLLGFIFWRALIALKIAETTNKIHVTIIFASWVAYQAQSMVSIDNLGIAVWGWLLGGILVGLSFAEDVKLVSVQKYFSANRTTRSPKLAFLFSSPILISVSFLVAILYRGEGLFYEQKLILASQNTSNNQKFREIALSTLDTPFVDPRYKFQTSVSLVNNGFVEDGLSGLISQQKNDPRDLLTLNALAEVYEQNGREQLAIEYRLKIGQLDPNDVKNFQNLSKLLKLTNQIEEARKFRVIGANLAALRK